MSQKWKSVAIPEPLFYEIKSFIESYPSYGYTSPNNFITRSASDKLTQMRMDPVITGNSPLDRLKMAYKDRLSRLHKAIEKLEKWVFDELNSLLDITKDLENIDETELLAKQIGIENLKNMIKKAKEKIEECKKTIRRIEKIQRKITQEKTPSKSEEMFLKNSYSELIHIEMDHIMRAVHEDHWMELLNESEMEEQD